MKTYLFHSKKTTLLYCLEDIKLQMKNRYDFLFFSIHPDYSYEDVNLLIYKIFQTKNYMAFHSIDAFKNDKIIEKGIVCLAIKFERKGQIKTFYIENIEEVNALENTSRYLNSNRDNYHLIFAGLVNEKFGFFLEELSLKITYSTINNIIGGISSGFKKDNEMLTYQFVDNKIIKKGFVIVSFKNIEAAMDISLGFIPYGITYTIKKAYDNKLYTVDNGKNFKEIIKNLLEGIENYDIKYLWYLPINILDEKDGYVATLRTPQSIEKNGVKFYGPLKRGQKFKLSFATPEELIQEDIKCATNIKNKLKYIELAFNFSCVARQYVLEEKKADEIKNYASILDSHLFGFFTFGEIGPDKVFKRLKFYNETSLIVGMREK